MNMYESICPICGKAKNKMIMSGVLSVMSQIYEPCACEILESKQKREEQIALGAKNYIKEKLCASGIVGRLRRYGFDTYDSTPDGAKEICMHWAQAYKKDSRTVGNLILIGGVGSGKTHLACAVLRDCIETKNLPVETLKRYADENRAFGIKSDMMFARAFDITESARKAFEDNNQFVERCKKANLLIIDDVGTRGEKYTEFQTATFFDIIDTRYIYERPTIITSNLSTQDLKECLGIRTYDRLCDNAQLVVLESKSHRRGKQ